MRKREALIYMGGTDDEGADVDQDQDDKEKSPDETVTPKSADLATSPGESRSETQEVLHQSQDM